MTYDFTGELGLAREWLDRPLDVTGQRWISACLFSRTSSADVTVLISERGPAHGLATDRDEREGWSVEEGAFYGNLFVPLDQPIDWWACRGAGQITSPDASGLLDRNCAKPDPAHPGFTLCGFQDAGDCGDFRSDEVADARHAGKPAPSAQVCESFKQHGEFYERCHTQPIADDDNHHQGHDHGGASCGHGDPVFEQVITTYVTP